MATPATVSYRTTEMVNTEEEGRLVPPPSCWFTDADLDAAAPSSSEDEDEEEDENSLIPQQQDDGELSSCDGDDCRPTALVADGTAGYYYEEHKGKQQELAATSSGSNVNQTEQKHHSSPCATTHRPIASTSPTTVNSTLQQPIITLPPLQQSPGRNQCTVSFSPDDMHRRPLYQNLSHNSPLHHHRHQVAIAGPSPSWTEISSQVLPSAARELLSSSLRRICHSARLGYSKGRWHRKYSDIGNNSGGYFRNSSALLQPTTSLDIALGGGASSTADVELPPFSSLPWVDRQMVQEWRTYLPEGEGSSDTISEHNRKDEDDDNVSHASSRLEALDEEEEKNILGQLSDVEEEDVDFDRARTLVPQPLARPTWQHADTCFDCRKPFGPTRLRHHCRLCGHSVCQLHSAGNHKLPHLGYDPDVPERVCDGCKRRLREQNLAERVAWRLARCRDFNAGQLTPYFDTGIDTVEQAALRIAQAALATARSIPLGAQATVAVETVEVLRKHGLNGIYGIMLRKEFLAAADLLRKALGINKTAWPLSVHELSAAIFYALAQHRAMRGINPDREEMIHSIIPTTQFADNPDTENNRTVGLSFASRRQTTAGSTCNSLRSPHEIVVDETDDYNPEVDQLTTFTDLKMGGLQLGGKTSSANASGASSVTEHQLPFTPVCTAVQDSAVASLIFYAPIALNFIYATKEVDMQLLAAQQGWRLLYAYLDPETDREGGHLTDKPASALFVHEQKKIAALAIRGTATIHDVVTDIRQVPVSFPEIDAVDEPVAAPVNVFGREDKGWTNVMGGKGLAVCGMATAAVNLYREHIDVLMHLVRQGYRIRITGHSLGGSIASLLVVLVAKEMEEMALKEEGVLKGLAITDALRVYAYGSPSCVDADLAEFIEPFVLTAVHHDDVVPRLTPTSCRGLLKHLLHIRETWVRDHLTDDLLAIGERARLAWAPRWRSGFTLTSSSRYTLRASSRSLKRYCKKKILSGKRQLLAVTEKLMRESSGSSGSSSSELPMAEMTQAQKPPHPNNNDSKLQEPGAAHQQTESPAAVASDMTDQTGNGPPDNDADQPALLLDFMGGVDNRTETLVIDGDEFFDIDATLLESEEDNSSTTEAFVDAWDEAKSHEAKESSRVTNEEAPTDEVAETPSPGDPQVFIDAPDDSAQNEVSECTDAPNASEEDGPGAVVLEEAPLPRMFIPGKIIHIYSHRGVYKAAYVPRSFRELRRISLAGNMLTDHKTKTYYEALLELMSVRNAPERPPRWTAYDEDDTCSCCASRFTWASTCDSEAQQARDKHNCRSCGTLVCDPCAMNRMPLASIGVTVPVRICDRCYNDIGGVLTSPSMTSSFAAAENSLSHDRVETEARPERQRDRRSVVVDDLAKRIKSSAFIK